jgi:hypothetical protein
MTLTQTLPTWRLVTAPAIEPLSVGEAKDWIRDTTTAEDPIIERLSSRRDGTSRS